MDSMTSNLNDNNKVVSLKTRMTALVTNPFQLKPLANTFKSVVSNEPHKMIRFCGRGSSRNLLLDQFKLMPITACSGRYAIQGVSKVRSDLFFT